MCAIMFLPRQFQVTVVENVDESHLKKAAWLLPAYMVAINLFVLPIAFAGLIHFQGAGVDADTFVLTLPMAHRQEALALLVFIGGLSAATGMVIVETIALSTMVCNDLVMPVLLRLRNLRLNERADLTALLLTIRRCAIVAVLLLGYLYFRAAGEAYALVSIGLISFAAVAQFAPATLGAIYWKGATRAGALCGLVAGFLVWAYTLLIPAFARSHWLPEGLLTAGPFGIELLRPVALFGLAGLDPVAHALTWSMIANIGCYVGVSLFSRQDAVQARQASLFVDVFHRGAERAPLWRGSADVASLRALLARFLGSAEADAILAEYARARGVADGAIEADAELVHHVERKLAGTLGGSSARIMVAAVVKEEAPSLEEVRAMLDEASQIVLYSHRLEQKSSELERATRELSTANERLKELDRMKDDFISTVSHELRTPLTSIRAFSEILHDNPGLDDEERTRYLKIVIKETERLTRLINQILDTSRLESGKLQWQVSEFDLKEVIEQAAAAMEPLFRERDVRLETRLPAGSVPVTADLDRIVQVLLNLLSNALKFCDAGRGRVEVSLRAQDGVVQVDVRDNGCGIAPQDQQGLFEKFRQGGDALGGRPSGSGLGLHISRHIVERFGGRMWVTSEAAQGACFSFTLPAAAEALARTA
jgi:signal transduction histidine kinase